MTKEQFHRECGSSEGIYSRRRYFPSGAYPNDLILKPRLIPLHVYRVLRTMNPSPYMYYLKMDDEVIVGTSPEALVKVDDERVETRPIAGTRPRGKTPEEDLALEKELLADEKERAEHLMLVDLGRNDIGRVSEFGTVKCDSYMEIERYSHVMHIVSNVSGKLREDKDFFDAFSPACRLVPYLALRSCGRWKLSPSWRMKHAALMRARSAIWASRAT